MEIFKLPSGRQIAYEFTYKSDPDRPTILLSNPLSAQFSIWDRVVARLHDAGFRVVRYDHPGHGESGVPADLSSTTFDSLASDVHALLAGIGAAGPRLHAWIGDSMGGALGVVFAAAHPGSVGRLVVCDAIACSPANAGVSPDPFAPRVEAARAAGSMDATVEETVGRWLGEWVLADPEEAERVRRLMRTTSVDGFETCIAALRSSTFDLRPLFGRLARCVERVLLVVGGNDADLPAKMAEMRDEVQKGFQAAGRQEKVELRVIPDAGHVPFIDCYDEFIEAVLPVLLVR